MAENKRYYWLKFKEDFFTSKRIKKLRKLGADYLIIYLKMQLKALKTEGYLYITGIEDSIADEIALDIDEDTDKVQLTLSYLQACNLLEISEDGVLFLPYVEILTDSETQAAIAKRKQRANKAQLEDKTGTMSGQCRPEIEKEKEIDIEIDIEKEIDNTPAPQKEPKHKYGEYQHVLLTDPEKERLIDDFGEDVFKAAIKLLDEYIEEKGYKAKSHNLTIRRWVINAVKERAGKTNNNKSVMDEWFNA